MNIIINRSDAIGDLILTTPVAKRLKDQYPDSKIIFIISKKCEDLLIDHPYIDEYFILEHKSSIFSRFSKLSDLFNQNKADIYIHFGGKHLPSFIAWLKGVPLRGGLKSKWQSFVFLNKAKRQRRSTVEMHESDYNLKVLEGLDIEYNKDLRDQYTPKINIPTDVKSKAIANFRESYLDSIEYSRMVIVHPGMTGHTLNWPSKYYAKFIKSFYEWDNEAIFVISYTPGDMKYIDIVKAKLEKYSDDIRSRVIYLDGTKNGLRGYMSVVSEADLFIGPSTGTTHIANVLGVKTIGIFSPIKVQSAKRWGPFNRDKDICRILVPDVICGENVNCVESECPYYPCMGNISVEDAIKESFKLIEGSK